MRKAEIKPALDALKKIKMPKIEDKALRNDIIENHFILLAAGKKFDADNEADQSVRLSGYDAEQQAIKDLQDKFNLAESDADRRDINRQMLAHKDYFKAVEDLNKSLNDRGKEAVEGLKPIDRVKFMEEIEKQEYDLGMIADLYPLFNIE